MPRTPLTAVEAAFVRLAHDAAGLTEAKQRVAELLAPLFAAHGVAPGTAGVSLEQDGDGLTLVTPEAATPFMTMGGTWCGHAPTRRCANARACAERGCARIGASAGGGA